MKNIYLAGRVTREDEYDENGEFINYGSNWREHVLIVGAFNDANNWRSASCWMNDWKWPILENAIFNKYNYTGPYFAIDNHGCPLGGVHEAEGYNFHYGKNIEEAILRLCENAICNSDAIFVWINDKTCYGTLVEIGYAKALSKVIWIAGPEKFNDLWFAYESADDTKFNENLTPREALREFLLTWDMQNTVFESPLEEMFWNHISKAINGLYPQFEVGKYRLDFAIPEKMIAIELDGHEYHKTKEQRTHDAQRERYLEMNGWHVIRFTGSEVYKSAERCVNEALTLINKWGNIK